MMRQGGFSPQDGQSLAHAFSSQDFVVREENSFFDKSIVVFRFTKFWEKNIVIIREKWSVGIMINKEWLEPRLA